MFRFSFSLLMVAVLSVWIQTASSSESPSRLRVMTYNVWDVGFAAGDYTESRLPLICRELKKAAESPDGWDIVLIQELWPELRKSALDDCGYPYVARVEDYASRMLNPLIAATRVIKGDRLDTGLRILSRYPISEVQRHTYSENGMFRHLLKDGDWLAKKSAMAARIEIPDHPAIWVVNTHLVSRNEKENYHVQRRMQLKELAAWISGIAGHEPVILGGDLNVGPRGTAVEPSAAYDEEIWENLFTEYFPNLDPSTQREDVCTYCNGENTFVPVADGRQRIDHILFSRHFQVESAGVAMAEKKRIRVKSLKNPEDDRLVVGHTSDGRYVLDVNLSDHFGWETSLTVSSFAK